MLCVGSELLGCGGTMGQWSQLGCNLHVGDGSGGRERRGLDYRGRGEKEGPDKSCPLANPACFGVYGVNICCGLLSSTSSSLHVLIPNPSLNP